jgi:type II secretory pathway component PulM
MKNVMQRLRALWNARDAREQRALAIMFIVIILASVAQLVWTAWHERERLRHQVPLRQMELAILQQQSSQLAKLAEKSATPTALAGPALERALMQEIAALPGKTSLRMLGPRQFDLRGDTAFDPFVAWMGKLQTDYGLRITAAEFSRASDSADGRVTLTVELAAE